MLKVFAFITALSCVAGCAQSPKVMEIPPLPVTQEPNTPFVFKPHYQAKRVGIDQQKVDHHSDFATIVSEEEYVFAPRKQLQDYRVVPASIDQSIPVEQVETAIQSTANEPINTMSDSYEKSPVSMVIKEEPDAAGICTDIACEDGSECGKVLTCGKQPCDAENQDIYNCAGSDCQLTPTAIAYMDSAKFAGMCGKFGDLFQCPNKTRCK